MSEPEEKEKSGFAWSLWIPVIMVFVVVSLGWYVRIQIAKENPIEFIPLETRNEKAAPETEQP